jgi:hypothetical protein
MSAENSFWMLVTMLRRCGPYRLQSLFLPGQPQVIISLYCLDRLIEIFLPALFSHFKEIRLTPLLFAHAWFTTTFGYTFPIKFTTQIWTIFFATGKVFLFRVGIGILKLLESALMKLDFDECLVALKNAANFKVATVVEEADKFSAVDEKLIKKLKKEAVKWLKSAPMM